MEKKTNKAKLEILKFQRKSVLSQGYSFDKIGGNYILPANSIKNMLIRIFLHAELISAMKTVQITTKFVKNAKRIEK